MTVMNQAAQWGACGSGFEDILWELFAVGKFPLVHFSTPPQLVLTSIYSFSTHISLIYIYIHLCMYKTLILKLTWSGIGLLFDFGQAIAYQNKTLK